MAKKKYYAVKNGRDGVSGVYLTWDDCKTQVEGAPGARYKSFPTLEEAEAFLTGEEAPAAKPARRDPPPMPFKEGAAVAYVDGSYRKDTREYAGGAVLFWQGEKLEFSQKGEDSELAEMHNVAGEILGAETVIRWCLGRNVHALEIYHDYSGVGMWGTGQWKTNRPGTQAYAAFCAQARNKLALSFVQVQGHSGDYWNDEADRLAREALGI